MEKEIVSTTLDKLDTISHGAKDIVEHIIDDALYDILVLSENPVLKNQNSSIESIESEMNTAFEIHRVFDDITLINIEGAVISSTSYNYRGSWSTNKWFLSVIDSSSTFYENLVQKLFLRQCLHNQSQFLSG